MCNPEWAKEEIFKDRGARAQNMDALKALMSEWIAGWKVQELYRAAQENRIPFAPVQTMEQIYENEQLRLRSFFVPFEQPGVGRLRLPGRPSQYGKTTWALRRPALGRARAESGRESLPAPRESLDQLENRNSTAPAARRCASARLHGSLGGTVWHADPRTPRRRDPAHRVDGAAAVLDPSAAAVRRRPAGNRPGPLLQPVQPGAEEHPS